jgi:hypothetical protein
MFMKTKITALLLSTSFLVAFKMLNDVLTDVGTTLQEVKQITLEQIAKKNFDLPRYTAQIRDACKKLPPGVREVTMMNLGKVVKDYVQSGSFQSEYMAYVEKQVAGRRSAPPMDDAKWAEEKKKRTDQMIKGMSSSEAVKTYAQILDPQLETAESMLKLLEESPDLKLGKSKEELQKEVKETKMLKELYAKDVEAFKIKFAEYMVDKQLAMQMSQQQAKQAETQQKINDLKDYKSIITNQLKQFLDLSATVDFNAQTMQKGNKVVFVNATYESKSGAWKLCFRSGKEAVTGARKFAQQWLNEMKAGA